MTEKSIAERMIGSVSKACEQSLAKFGHIPTMWHILTGDGEFVVTEPILSDKDQDVRMIRAVLQAVEAQAVLFAGEGWEVVLSADDGQDARSIVASTHPDRREVLMLQGEDDHGEVCGRRLIIRDSKGKPTLGPLEVMRPQRSEGRFIGLLPMKGMKQ